MVGPSWLNISAFALLTIRGTIAQGPGYASPQVYPSRKFHELPRRSNTKADSKYDWTWWLAGRPGSGSNFHRPTDA
jgi:hypothetical protein